MEEWNRLIVEHIHDLTAEQLMVLLAALRRKCPVGPGLCPTCDGSSLLKLPVDPLATRHRILIRKQMLRGKSPSAFREELRTLSSKTCKPLHFDATFLSFSKDSTSFDLPIDSKDFTFVLLDDHVHLQTLEGLFHCSLCERTFNRNGKQVPIEPHHIRSLEDCYEMIRLNLVDNYQYPSGFKEYCATRNIQDKVRGPYVTEDSPIKGLLLKASDLPCWKEYYLQMLIHRLYPHQDLENPTADSLRNSLEEFELLESLSFNLETYQLPPPGHDNEFRLFAFCCCLIKDSCTRAETKSLFDEYLDFFGLGNFKEDLYLDLELSSIDEPCESAKPQPVSCKMALQSILKGVCQVKNMKELFGEDDDKTLLLPPHHNEADDAKTIPDLSSEDSLFPDREAMTGLQDDASINETL